MNNTDTACACVRASAREAQEAEARLRAREAAERAKPIINANDPKWMDDNADQMERVFGPNWRAEQAEQKKRLDDLAKTARHPEWL